MMTLLAIDWSVLGIKVAQFILAFSILVTLHELGHFLPARWFKCRVEKFYLFFNPWFSLAKKKIGDTEYGLGWVPFGGYVKISGMIDESMDKEQMKLPPEPHEFRSKKAWQRLIIMLGGIIVNVILAIIIFIGVMWHWGEQYIPNSNLTYGIATDSLAKSIGLKNGDKMVSIDGKPIDDFRGIVSDIVFKEAKALTVNRNGQTVNIDIPETLTAQLAQRKAVNFITPRIPYYIDSVSKEVNLVKGSLLKGDRVIGFNDQPIEYFDEYVTLKKDLANVDATLVLLRNEKDTIQTTVHLSEAGTIGVITKSATELLKDSVKTYTLLQAIPAGTKSCFDFLGNQISAFKQMFSGKVKASDSLGSVISIGNTFPGVWDWQKFWMLTGMFSIILAFMNLLPIPALDGGHALFCLTEMISGKKPSDKFMERAQTVGMVLLLSLMVYALGLDFWRLLK
jgi:regulator of sigma E protease